MPVTMTLFAFANKTFPITPKFMPACCRTSRSSVLLAGQSSALTDVVRKTSPGDWRQETGQTFRLACRGDDLNELADLWVSSWQAVMPGINFVARRSWFLAYLKDLEEQGAVTICAFRGESALGFILLDQARGILEQIAVWPELFGSGVALLLLDEAKRRCPSGLTLEVNADNARGLRFYEKAGFERHAPGINPTSGLKTWRMRWLGMTG
jgi:putative acetyltransferase